PAIAPVTAGKPRGTTQVVTRGILMIGVINAGGLRYCSTSVRGGSTRQYEVAEHSEEGVCQVRGGVHGIRANDWRDD
ncbi:hypothetical protein Tco_1581293, partial [Tanacetum coccineum]